MYMKVSFQACQLPIFEYLVEKMCSLCYDRAWYAKFGGYVLFTLIISFNPVELFVLRMMDVVFRVDGFGCQAF